MSFFSPQVCILWENIHAFILKSLVILYLKKYTIDVLPEFLRPNLYVRFIDECVLYTSNYDS